jgi:hypothetical protein
MATFQLLGFNMLYTLVVVVSMHWGTPATMGPQIHTHDGISYSQCQAESQSWVNWQNQLKVKMAGNGDVAVYPSCLPEGPGTNWWGF